MKVYVFGAGASRAAQEDFNLGTELLPPLVNDLFGHQDYHRWAEDIGLSAREFAELRNRASNPGFSLEDWLTEEWEAVERLQEERTKHSRRVDLGRLAFYFWRLFLHVSSAYRPGNLYELMLEKLRVKGERFGLITFNYDILLDRAYEYRYGAILTSLEGYLEWDYVKPHGSVNWLLMKRDGEPEISSPEGEIDNSARFRLASRLMFNGPPIALPGRLHVIEPSHGDLASPHRILRRLHNEYFYPLIFMPLTTKLYSFVEGFSQSVIAKGKDLLSSTDEIFLIGYQAKDAIILEMLESARPNTLLHVIGRGHAHEVVARIIKAVPRLRTGLVYSQGFKEFVGATL